MAQRLRWLIDLQESSRSSNSAFCEPGLPLYPEIIADALNSSEQDTFNQSQIEVSHRHIFDREKLNEISRNGPLDGRMGTSKKHIKCDTCHESMQACNGHFGYVKLVLPVFHAGYFKRVIAILSSICKVCMKWIPQLSASNPILRNAPEFSCRRQTAVNTSNFSGRRAWTASSTKSL